MKGFLGKLFGGKQANDPTVDMAGDALQGLIDKAGLEVSFDLGRTDKGLHVDLYGEDEELFTNKEGQLLDAVQLFLKRTVQNHNPEDKISLIVDCDNYRERADKELEALAEKLKGIVLSKGKPVYFRALPPRDRKIVHQYLADEKKIQSRSVGEGLYKKIKISLAGKGGQSAGNSKGPRNNQRKNKSRNHKSAGANNNAPRGNRKNHNNKSDSQPENIGNLKAAEPVINDKNGNF